MKEGGTKLLERGVTRKKRVIYRHKSKQRTTMKRDNLPDPVDGKDVSDTGKS